MYILYINIPAQPGKSTQGGWVLHTGIFYGWMFDYGVYDASLCGPWISFQGAEPSEWPGTVVSWGGTLRFWNVAVLPKLFQCSCHGNWETLIWLKKFVYECAYMSAWEKDKHEAYVCITVTICSYLHPTNRACVCVCVCKGDWYLFYCILQFLWGLFHHCTVCAVEILSFLTSNVLMGDFYSMQQP